MSHVVIAWVAATVFSLIGWGSLLHYAWIVRRWPAANGRVIDNVAEWQDATHGLGREAIYFPVLEYGDTAGAPHRARGLHGKSGKWDIGETVPLHFDPANPDSMRDINRASRLAFSGTFILFGVGALLTALGRAG